MTELYVNLQKAELFTGLTKTYTPIVEDDKEVVPNESKAVQQCAADIFREIVTKASEACNLHLSVDCGNLQNITNLEVEPGVGLKEVPVLFLLQFDKILTDISTAVSKTVTLDSAHVWKPDGRPNIFRREPIVTSSTRRVNKAVQLAAATDKHPAQVQLVPTDEPRGNFETTHFSGAIPANVRDQVLDRIAKLRQAIHDAIAVGNSRDADMKKGTEQLLEWVFQPAFKS